MTIDTMQSESSQVAVRPTELSLRHPPVSSSSNSNKTAATAHLHRVATGVMVPGREYSSTLPTSSRSNADNASTGTEARSHTSQHTEEMERIRQEKVRLAQVEFQKKQQEKAQKLQEAERHWAEMKEKKMRLLAEKQKERQRLNEEKQKQAEERRQKQEEAIKLWRAKILQRTQQAPTKRTSTLTPRTPTSGGFSSSTKRSREEQSQQDARPKSAQHVQVVHPFGFGSSTPRPVCGGLCAQASKSTVHHQTMGMKNSHSTAGTPLSARDPADPGGGPSWHSKKVAAMFHSLYDPSTSHRKPATDVRRSVSPATKRPAKAISTVNKRPKLEQITESVPLDTKPSAAKAVSVSNKRMVTSVTNPKRPLLDNRQNEQKEKNSSQQSRTRAQSLMTTSMIPTTNHRKVSTDTTTVHGSPAKRNSLTTTATARRGSCTQPSKPAAPLSTTVEHEVSTKPSETETELQEYRAKMAEARRIAAERREMERKLKEEADMLEQQALLNAVSSTVLPEEDQKSVSSTRSNKESAFFEGDEMSSADNSLNNSQVNSDNDFSLRSDEESIAPAHHEKQVDIEGTNTTLQASSEADLSDSQAQDTPFASMTNSCISTGPSMSEEQKALEQQEREERKRKVMNILSRVKQQPPPQVTSPSAVDSVVSPPPPSTATADPVMTESSTQPVVSPLDTVPSPSPTTAGTQFKSALLQNMLAKRRLSAGAHGGGAQVASQAPQLTSPSATLPGVVEDDQNLHAEQLSS